MRYTALVTGASGGIGKAVAASLCRNGFHTLCGYSSHLEKAEELCDELRSAGHSAIPVRLDVTSEEDIIEAVAAAASAGPLAAVVNCAGIASIRQIQDVTADEISRILSVNLAGTITVCREAAKVMIRQKSGSIVNISSMWGVTGASCESVYSASKGGIISFTRALAKELGPSGITVNCIAPGVIDTEMNSMLSEEDLAALADETPLGRIGLPEDIAEAALYLCRASFVTGQCLTVDGGLTL